MNKWLTSLHNKLKQFLVSIKRFPESSLLTSSLALVLILSAENILDEILSVNIFLSLLLGFLLTLNLVLLIERQTPLSQDISTTTNVTTNTLNISNTLYYNKYRFLGNLGIVLICLIFYFLLPETKTTAFITFYVSLSFILFFTFTLIPYLGKKINYSFYMVRLLLNIALSYFYALVLFAGVSGLVFAIETLFELDFSGMIYLDVFIISTFVFGNLYFISTLEHINYEAMPNQYPVAIKVLLTVIIYPLTIAYTAVLYAYFLRILMTMEWPNQIVANLILWYGLIAFAGLCATDSLTQLAPWIYRFKNWFFTLFILPTLMLFISIGIRIYHYGLTFQRYYVLFIGIWFSGVIFYHLLKKLLGPRLKLENGTFYILLGVFLLLITSFGPISAVNLSYHSQEKRLTHILTEEGLLNNGILTPNTNLEQTTTDTIISLVNYLEQIDRLDNISYLPNNFNPYDQMEAVFGFNYYYQYYSPKNYYSYSLETYESIYLDHGYVNNFQHYDSHFISYVLGDFIIELDTNFITVTNNKEAIYQVIELAEIMEQLADAYPTTYNLDQDKLTFNYNLNDTTHFQIIFANFGFFNEKNAYHMDHMDGILIISN